VISLWVGLQIDFDTEKAKDNLADVLSRIQRFEPTETIAA
jgi:hypothetical protein